MNESSTSRSDEFDPITDYHHLKFENRCLKASGDEFQRLFEEIMELARPDEFTKVRPYGDIGDRKCDGLIESEGTIFQVYSPDKLTQAKLQKKINEDLDGAVQYWGDRLKKWVFVYNVRDGIAPDIPTTLEQKRKQYPNIEIIPWTNAYLWEIALSLSLQQRAKIFGAPPPTVNTEEIVAPLISSQGYEINWQNICRGMLPIELDANPLISGDGVTLGIEDIVPLDLVEQKERPKPTRDPSPDNSQQVLEDQEIPLPYNQFFDHVLTGCRSLNQQGKGIAIIGEPGAGKTTLLCAIANWIIKRDELPVFVSLQDLEAGLESYLLEVWLKKAIRKREASVQLQDDLIQQCNAGRVWLLLDGVDEMAQAQQSLSNLAKEFRGWVGDVRIVLTCRVNVWEANRNELRSKFGIYRSRGFRDEDQLIFIKNFFAKAKQLETGNKLIEKLTSAPARLKDLIKSPLWITLLCRTWKRQEGKLPATKAELYEGFTKTFYDWKDKPYVPEEKRPLLERALGELAKKAIDQKDFRFRLRESFIRQELDKLDSSFFRIACELGWINKLGTAVEKTTDEAVYAFLHPTFQEYFAALAIDDWYFFLNPFPENPNHADASYRIFEEQWKEVFLLWLGRNDLIKNLKEGFLNRLAEFNDNCENSNFYFHKAYFLTVVGTAEFPQYSKSEEVIQQSFFAAFGYLDVETNEWKGFLKPISDAAKTALYEADKHKVIFTLINNFPADEAEGLLAINRFGNKFDSNLDDIKFLICLLKNQYLVISYQAAHNLMRIGVGNQFLIKELRKILESQEDTKVHSLVAWTLGKVNSGDPYAIHALTQLLKLCQNDKDRLNIVEKLIDTSPSNIDSIREIIKFISLETDWESFRQARDILKKTVFSDSVLVSTIDKMTTIIEARNHRIQDAIYKHFNTSKEQTERIKIDIQRNSDVQELINLLIQGEGEPFDSFIKGKLIRRIIEVILELDDTEFLAKMLSSDKYSKIHSEIIYMVEATSLINSKLIKILINFLRFSQSQEICSRIAKALERISQPELLSKVVMDLNNISISEWCNEDFYRYQSRYDILWHCAQNMSYPDFYRAWHSSSSTEAKSPINS